MAIPAEVRFQRFINKTATCWLWTGVTGGSNVRYGYFNPTTQGRGQKVPAHRFAYEMWVGLIPDGLELDHLCRVPLCVRPSHLEAVTHAENRRRARLLVCRSGRHDLTIPENVRWDAQGNRRGCIQCHRGHARERGRRNYTRKKAMI